MPLFNFFFFFLQLAHSFLLVSSHARSSGSLRTCLTCSLFFKDFYQVSMSKLIIDLLMLLMNHRPRWPAHILFQRWKLSFLIPNDVMLCANPEYSKCLCNFYIKYILVPLFYALFWCHNFVIRKYFTYSLYICNIDSDIKTWIKIETQKLSEYQPITETFEGPKCKSLSR